MSSVFFNEYWGNYEEFLRGEAMRLSPGGHGLYLLFRYGDKDHFIYHLRQSQRPNVCPVDVIKAAAANVDACYCPFVALKPSVMGQAIVNDLPYSLFAPDDVIRPK
jgi:hypothetical protein